MSIETKLSKILLANAVFSLINGGALMILATPIALQFFVPDFQLFELTGNEVLLLLGAGLLGFGSLVGLVALNINQHRKQTRLIIFADIAWVITTLFLFVTTDIFSQKAYIYLSAVAIIVALFGVLQYKEYKKD